MIHVPTASRQSIRIGSPNSVAIGVSYLSTISAVLQCQGAARGIILERIGQIQPAVCGLTQLTGIVIRIEIPSGSIIIDRCQLVNFIIDIRIITVIAAAAAVMIAVTLSAAAFCELFTHMLRESFPAYNQYSIQNNGDIENGVYTLTYLPNGFFLSEQSEDIDFVLKSWKNAAGNCILFQQFRAESLTLSIDNEKNTSEQIIVKGIPVDLYTGDQLSTAVWALDGCCFCISYYGEISAEEMIALIEGSQICAE